MDARLPVPTESPIKKRLVQWDKASRSFQKEGTNTESLLGPTTANLTRRVGPGLEEDKVTEGPTTDNLARIVGPGLAEMETTSDDEMNQRINHTRMEIGKMMNSIFHFLNFTTELQTDYDQGYICLPLTYPSRCWTQEE